MYLFPLHIFFILLQLQDGIVSTLRRGRRMQIRREVPVRSWNARAPQSAAASQVQDRTVPHFPQRRILPVRTALPLCAQRRRGTQSQSRRPRCLRPCRSRRRSTDADVATDEPVHRIRSCIANRFIVAVTLHIDGQLLPRPGQSEQFLVARILVPSQSAAVARHGHKQFQLIAGGNTAATAAAAATATATIGRHPSAHLQPAELHHGQLQASGHVSDILFVWIATRFLPHSPPPQK